MNSSAETRRRRVKSLALAFTLALPSAAIAVSTDVVKTRADQNIDQQYGRDSVYGFSPESKPLSPERTSGPHWMQRTQAYNANADERYEGYLPKQQAEPVALNEPRGERYEGYVPKQQAEPVAFNQPELIALDGTAYQFGSGYTKSG